MNALVSANLLAQALLFFGAVWCIAFPTRRIYPMAGKNGWYYAMWALFYFVLLTNPIFVVLDWNTGVWASPLRYWVAAPLALTGALLFGAGFTSLGMRNTSGLRDGFVARGPYLLTRNPQYLGDILMFAGVTIAANSGVVLVTHALISLTFVLAPFAEEPWLDAQYGEAYVAYRHDVPRFL